MSAPYSIPKASVKRPVPTSISRDGLFKLRHKDAVQDFSSLKADFPRGESNHASYLSTKALKTWIMCELYWLFLSVSSLNHDANSVNNVYAILSTKVNCRLRLDPGCIHTFFSPSFLYAFITASRHPRLNRNINNIRLYW
jgi:hypothetical protein